MEIGKESSTCFNANDYVQAKGAKNEVLGELNAGPIPKEETDPTRLAIRRTMKQLSGPYKEFEGYYPLEDTIELYMEIWYESSSSDEE